MNAVLAGFRGFAGYLGGVLGAPVTMLIWMPMLAFEVPAGVWLLVKAVPPSRA